MESIRNIRLIDAVEAKNVELVKKLLASGADANFRKKVTLTRNVDRGSKTDTVECESLLALAIIFGSVDITTALLEAGADPRQEIKWNIPYTESDNWTLDKWKNRWCPILQWPSALALALSLCGKATRLSDEAQVNSYVDFHNGNRLRPLDLCNGKFPTSKAGAEVQLSGNPTTIPDLFIEVNHQPRLDMVASLLKHGGPFLVTPELYAAVKSMSDTRFLQLMEHSLDEGMELAKEIIRPTPGSNDVADLRAQVEALTTRILSDDDKHQQSVQNLKLQFEVRIAALERKVAILQQSGPSTHQSQEFPPPIDVKKVMHVNADYSPLQSDEIELMVGQMVFCNLQYHDGWGQGMNTITGVSGYFPMSHVSTTPTPMP
ncbi:hypothetical protein HDU93_001327, partial [Gonapodya sp. JEL0774]